MCSFLQDFLKLLNVVFAFYGWHVITPKKLGGGCGFEVGLEGEEFPLNFFNDSSSITLPPRDIVEDTVAELVPLEECFEVINGGVLADPPVDVVVGDAPTAEVKELIEVV